MARTHAYVYDITEADVDIDDHGPFVHLRLGDVITVPSNLATIKAIGERIVALVDRAEAAHLLAAEARCNDGGPHTPSPAETPGGYRCTGCTRAVDALGRPLDAPVAP